MTLTDTYTLDMNGDVRRGLTAGEVGEEILGADGHVWDIRAIPTDADRVNAYSPFVTVSYDDDGEEEYDFDEDGFAAEADGARDYVVRRSQRSHASMGGVGEMVETRYRAWGKDRDDAKGNILCAVGIDGPENWRGCGAWSCMTDANYDVLQSEGRAE